MAIGRFLLLMWQLLCVASLGSATTTTKPTTTSTATSAKNPYSVKTVKPSNCPSPTPVGNLIFHSNKTASQQLGGSVAVYNGTNSASSQLNLTVTSGSNKGAALVNLGYGTRLTVTANDGSTLQYTAGANSITIINPGCTSSYIYTNSTKTRQADVVKRDVEKRATPQITVTVDLTDYCGYPVSSATPQLACTPVLYPPDRGGNDPVYGTPEYSNMDGGPKGQYVGYCSITAQLSAANNQYSDCQNDVSQTLEQFKKQQEAAEGALNYIEKLAPYFETAEKLSGYLKGPLGFWSKYNTFLNSPPIRQQLGQDDCSVPDDFSLGLQDASYSQSIGTIVATPTFTTIAAGVPTCVAGGSCNCVSACNSAFSCGCLEVDNGNSAPICTTSLSCSGQSCSSSKDCPSGQSCFTNTCCGAGVCATPSCPNSNSAKEIFERGSRGLKMFEQVARHL